MKRSDARLVNLLENFNYLVMLDDVVTDIVPEGNGYQYTLTATGRIITRDQIMDLYDNDRLKFFQRAYIESELQSALWDD